jgi:hypothetical protein
VFVLKFVASVISMTKADVGTNDIDLAAIQELKKKK